MKIKQQPDDFRVEEENRLEAGRDGPFTLYRLEKAGIGTPEALAVVSRSWHVRRADFSFAGLKDRYGRTGQVVSLRKGPGRNFEGKGFKLNYLGRSREPAGRGTIVRNRFRIVLRDLAADEAGRVEERAREAAVCGFPDYYDDQRFGSLRGTHGAFVAAALLEGDHEKALRLAIASPSRADRSRLRKRRVLLKEKWGAWGDLAGALDASGERDICRRLADGASFEDAYACLDRVLRSLHLAAYQAHVFNAELRERVGTAGPSHPGVDREYRFYEGDPGALRDVRLELFTDERLKFRRGARNAVVLPENLETTSPEPDELNRNRVRVELAFALRPGSYATMLIKRCTYDM